MSKSSQYYGVSKTKQTSYTCVTKKFWRAKIDVNGEHISCGMFVTEKDAALAVDKKIIELNLDKPLNILKKK